MTTIANYWGLQGGKPSVDEMLAKMRRSEDAVTGTLLARIDPEIARLVVGLKAASQQARRYLTETAEECDGARRMFEDEKATSTHLEELNELMTLDFERERAENERLCKALNQIAMSSLSSEYAKGRAAIALQGG